LGEGAEVAVSLQLSRFSCQLSTFSYQQSALGYQMYQV